jgi:hypothetical protein
MEALPPQADHALADRINRDRGLALRIKVDAFRCCRQIDSIRGKDFATVEADGMSATRCLSRTPADSRLELRPPAQPLRPRNLNPRSQ